MMAGAQILWTNWVIDGLAHYAPWDLHGHIQLGHVESMNCWCAPELLANCCQCNARGCWKCNGTGTVDGSIHDPMRVRQVNHRSFRDDDEQ